MGSIIGAAGSIVGGIASANNSDYQAAVAQANAGVEDANAKAALQAGISNAYDLSLQNAGAAGKLKANQAASGINVNSGSDVSVQESQREVGQQNVGTSLYNSARTSYGYRVAAVSDNAQATLDQQQAQQAMIASYFNAAGDIVGGSGGGGSASGALSLLGG